MSFMQSISYLSAALRTSGCIVSSETGMPLPEKSLRAVFILETSSLTEIGLAFGAVLLAPMSIMSAPFSARSTAFEKTSCDLVYESEKKDSGLQLTIPISFTGPSSFT